jgi:predicted GTPase
MSAAGRGFDDFNVGFRGNPTHQIGPALPAMGNGPQQVKELQDAINATICDLIVAATPLDLRRVLRVNKPCERVWYDLQEIGQPTLADLLGERFA